LSEKNDPNLCSASYQLSGPGRSRRYIVYDRRRIADCRAWLTERLGLLAYFAEIESPQPRAADLRVEPAADEAEATADAEPAAPDILEPEPIPLVDNQPAIVVRRCRWFVDTTGETFRCCGEPIADGRDWCKVHRYQYACALMGAAIRPPMPFGPYPTATPSNAPTVTSVTAKRGRRAPRF
jgi:hypothetical protein